MSLFEEKRKLGDRRVRDDGPPPGCRERRVKKRDRRQTEISEISFHEWTRYFLRYKKHVAAKAEIKARKPVASQASSPSHTVLNARIAARQEEDDVPDPSITPPSSL
jgi:hypothetical protein